jgi:hypothetical protein
MSRASRSAAGAFGWSTRTTPDLGFEAVGSVDARYESHADWKEPFREGVVYYLAEGRVRGVLLWNTWDQADHARRLIEESKPVTGKDLDGRLPVAEAS